MYELMVESTFSAAHQLTKSKTKCEELHGHNWKVQLFVTGEPDSEIGWVYDFSKLKKLLKTTLHQLDHKFLNEILEISPTAENIAKFIFDDIESSLPIITKVSVWESENSCATYVKS